MQLFFAAASQSLVSLTKSESPSGDLPERFVVLQQQRNGHDCGMFGIASTFECASSESVSVAVYESTVMRTFFNP